MTRAVGVAACTVHQVVLTSGQAIWYDSPTGLAADLQPLLQTTDDDAYWARKDELTRAQKARLGLQEDDVLFMSAQVRVSPVIKHTSK
jgi:hypothetical protein